MTHAVVLKLLEGLGNRGHHVYMDNYYSSPSLFQNLRHLGFGACGTVRTNRHGVPEEIKAKLQKGEIVSKMIDNNVLALKWMNKRPIAMFTTVHNDSIVTKQRRTRAVQGRVEEVRRSAAVVLRVFTTYAEVVEEGILPFDRSGHSECLHNVSHNPM